MKKQFYILVTFAALPAGVSSCDKGFEDATPYNAADALELINTQYWISSFLHGSEAWANLRRSGFPALAPNPYPAADATVKGGFIHRLVYPTREVSVNTANYKAAAARISGDNLATRIFWN